jgi:16S rRNA (guanine966-N2)-methyltransferase
VTRKGADAGSPPRVTAGVLRGRVVRVPPTGGVRPMLARTRQALFNVLGNDVTGNVWDCFAGSGLLGLEALSRGADHAVFIERDARHARVVEQNLAGLGVAERCTVIRGSALAAVRPSRHMPHCPARLVFLDPPHAMAADHGSDFWPWLRELSDTPLLDFATVVVLGHPARMELPDTGPLSAFDTRCYGSVAFTLLRL